MQSQSPQGKKEAKSLSLENKKARHRDNPLTTLAAESTLEGIKKSGSLRWTTRIQNVFCTQLHNSEAPTAACKGTWMPHKLLSSQPHPSRVCVYFHINSLRPQRSIIILAKQTKNQTRQVQGIANLPNTTQLVLMEHLKPEWKIPPVFKFHPPHT